MTTLILPDPIAAYFAADQKTPETVARCFTAQATVRDEDKTHSGRDAIAAWRSEAAAKYTYTTEPFELDVNEGHPVVRCHVAGNFPGSPVDLRYHFRLERGLIASLEIAP